MRILATFTGIARVLIGMNNTPGSDFMPPWEVYQRALCKAQAARGQFLRNGFIALTKPLKNRICCQARKWHIRLCPLCC